MCDLFCLSTETSSFPILNKLINFYLALFSHQQNRNRNNLPSVFSDIIVLIHLKSVLKYECNRCWSTVHEQLHTLKVDMQSQMIAEVKFYRREN